MRKELVLEHEPVSVLMTVLLILLAPASLSVLFNRLVVSSDRRGL